ncbi:MAG: hypothetical protein R3B59_00420 [Dehalococcoidia bacterium]
MDSQPPRRRLITLALLGATLMACAGNSGASTGAPTPFFTPRGATTATPTPSEATAAAPTSSDAPAPSTARGSTTRDGGTLVLAGNSYAFTVRTCDTINGEYHLVGDGDASVALASVLIVQTDGRGSFIVDEPDASSAGTTLTVSGPARNLVLPGDRVPLTLTATCPGLAN